MASEKQFQDRKLADLRSKVNLLQSALDQSNQRRNAQEHQQQQT